MALSEGVVFSSVKRGMDLVGVSCLGMFCRVSGSIIVFPVWDASENFV